jgi:hypothetical protein
MALLLERYSSHHSKKITQLRIKIQIHENDFKTI